LPHRRRRGPDGLGPDRRDGGARVGGCACAFACRKGTSRIATGASSSRITTVPLKVETALSTTMGATAASAKPAA
jgi:hypothetical protein